MLPIVKQTRELFLECNPSVPYILYVCDKLLKIRFNVTREAWTYFLGVAISRLSNSTRKCHEEAKERKKSFWAAAILHATPIRSMYSLDTIFDVIRFWAMEHTLTGSSWTMDGRTNCYSMHEEGPWAQCALPENCPLNCFVLIVQYCRVEWTRTHAHTKEIPIIDREERERERKTKTSTQLITPEIGRERKSGWKFHALS